MLLRVLFIVSVTYLVLISHVGTMTCFTLVGLGTGKLLKVIQLFNLRWGYSQSSLILFEDNNISGAN